MMKRILATLFLTFAINSISYATPPKDVAKSTEPEPIDALDVFLDIPLRVSGFLQTVLGTTVFVGTSPITAVLSAFPPHDTLDRTAESLIFRPARYTFERNIGDTDFEPLKHKKSQVLAVVD